MNVWLYTLTSVGFLSLLSLVGIFAMSKKGLAYLNRSLSYLISLAAGVMLGGAIFHLLPEAAMAIGTDEKFSLALAASFVVFFILEKFLLIHHHGTSDGDLPEVEIETKAARPFVWINLLGGAIHNLVDGVTIAVTFLLYPAFGLTTVLATTLHEIPREIGDFAILIHGGLSVKKALIFNLLTTVAAFFGAFAALLIGAHLKAYSDLLLPIAAANFLYIALANLLPELAHVRSRRQSVIQTLLIVFGLTLMYFLKRLTD